MNPHASDAPQLACHQCGGSFGLVELRAEVTCPFCRHRQALPDHELARLRDYRATVDAELRRMSEHGSHVAAADRFIESYSTRGGAAGMVLFLVGTPALAVAGFATLQRFAPTSPHVAGAYFAAVGLMAFFVARWIFGAKPRDSEQVAVGPVAVACPECAAPATMTAGSAADVCGFCGGQLIATAVAAERGVREATLAARRTSLQKLRKEREVMLHVNRPGTFFKIYAFSCIFVMLGGFVFVGAREGPTEGLVAAAVSGTLMAIVAGITIRGAMRERARKRAYRDVAQQLRGTTSFGVPALIAWLDRYWPAAYPVQHLYKNAHLIEANTGFPTMIALYDERIDVFLAADTTATAGSQQANQERAWLQQLGFTVRTTEGGAWLEASPELRKKLARDIPAARLLSTVVLHAARFLSANRASPATAID